MCLSRSLKIARFSFYVVLEASTRSAPGHLASRIATTCNITSQASENLASRISYSYDVQHNFMSMYSRQANSDSKTYRSASVLMSRLNLPQCFRFPRDRYWLALRCEVEYIMNILSHIYCVGIHSFTFPEDLFTLKSESKSPREEWIRPKYQAPSSTEMKDMSQRSRYSSCTSLDHSSLLMHGEICRVSDSPSALIAFRFSHFA